MNLIEALCERRGRYEGRGATDGGHDRHELVATMVVSPVADGLAVAIELEERDPAGDVVHAEHAVVAATPDGTLGLYPVSTTLGFVLPHELLREDPGVYVFGHGDVADHARFRQEVTIELHDDGDVGWRVAWAQPGEDMEPRSHVRLSPAG